MTLPVVLILLYSFGIVYCANSLEGVRLCWTLLPREGLSVNTEQYCHKSAVISPYWTLLQYRFWLSEHHSHRNAIVCLLSTIPTDVMSSVCAAHHSHRSASCPSTSNSTIPKVLMSFSLCWMPLTWMCCHFRFVSCGIIVQFFEHSAGYGSFQLQSICICDHLNFVHLGRLGIPTPELT